MWNGLKRFEEELTRRFLMDLRRINESYKKTDQEFKDILSGNVREETVDQKTEVVKENEHNKHSSDDNLIRDYRLRDGECVWSTKDEKHY